jgi:DNA-binding transcriptional LysR family regulator
MGGSENFINVNLPTVRQLQCFLAVAQELNFRKAAERLNMTQSPLTRQIQGLEDILGQELFSRNTHKVHLTNAGQRLTTKAEHILIELKALKYDNFSSKKTLLRIGLTIGLNFENILPLNKVLNDLVSTEEGIIQNMTSSQLVQCLVKNTLDIVLTGEQPPGWENEIQFYWLYREPLLLAMPTAHPASCKEKVSLTDVSDLPLFWFPRNENPTYYDKCENYFKSLDFSLKQTKEPDDSLLMLSWIIGGKGMALMPRSLCSFKQDGLCYRALTNETALKLNIDVYAALRKHENQPAVLNALEVLLRKGTATNKYY